MLLGCLATLTPYTRQRSHRAHPEIVGTKKEILHTSCPPLSSSCSPSLPLSPSLFLSFSLLSLSFPPSPPLSTPSVAWSGSLTHLTPGCSSHQANPAVVLRVALREAAGGREGGDEREEKELEVSMLHCCASVRPLMRAEHWRKALQQGKVCISSHPPQTKQETKKLINSTTSQTYLNCASKPKPKSLNPNRNPSTLNRKYEHDIDVLNPHA